jgi:hypothetical protein
MAQRQRIRRFDTDLRVEDTLPPQPRGYCLCGCGRRLPPRKRKWAKPACQFKATQTYLIRKGDRDAIKDALRSRDLGKCTDCKQQVEKLSRYRDRDTGLIRWMVVEKIRDWQAHHVHAVSEGGINSDLDGYATLCLLCHRGESQQLRARRRK